MNVFPSPCVYILKALCNQESRIKIRRSRLKYKTASVFYAYKYPRRRAIPRLPRKKKERKKKSTYLFVLQCVVHHLSTEAEKQLSYCWKGTRTLVCTEQLVTVLLMSAKQHKISLLGEKKITAVLFTGNIPLQRILPYCHQSPHIYLASHLIVNN